jgi:HAD superfamily hydrolase (TIGR01484 family)
VRPLAEFVGAKRVRGLLFDIDDTLTTDGVLGAGAYAAMERLQRSGRLLVAVTGRPAGWCDLVARLWPVDAVIGENGAFWFARAGRRVERCWLDDAATRAANRARLAAIGARILAAVPGAALAADQPWRETDLAVDWCEDVQPPLSLETALRVRDLMVAEGLSAKVSSIHVNGWFGRYDKLETAKRLFAERYRVDLARANADYAFVGDSPNDAPMFAFFGNSIGVANVRRFEGRLEAAPRYVTRAPAGAGFAEVAAHLLGGR